MISIGHAVRVAREAERLTQDELAERSGLTRSAIARIESGKSTPTVTTLQLLAKGLGRTLEIRIER